MTKPQSAPPWIKKLILEIIKPVDYDEWMKTPNVMFGFKTPQYVVMNGQAHIIEKALKYLS